MTIHEIVKAGYLCSEVECIKTCSCITLDFVNNEGAEDATQLTIAHNIFTKAGISELETLFNSLCKEFNTRSNSVTALTIVASANTMSELITMGY